MLQDFAKNINPRLPILKEKRRRVLWMGMCQAPYRGSVTMRKIYVRLYGRDAKVYFNLPP